MKFIRLSFEARIVFFAVASLIFYSGLAAWLLCFIEPWWLAWVMVLIPAISLTVYGLHRVISPVNRLISALNDGIASFSDADFSVSVAVDRTDEIGDLARAQNALGDILRRERQSLYQRELLLDTVIQSAPTSMVLCDQRGRVVYSNTAARHLLAGGKAINGVLIPSLIDKLPAILQQAFLDERDGLFTVENEEQLTYHLSVNRFTLNTQAHKLYLVKHLTYEINRQEVSIWKKVIRLISHELNNSLAPISSLAHSGKLISEREKSKTIRDIFFTIEDRAQHLKTFIEGYARFARLPLPRLETVQLAEFLSSLSSLETFMLMGDVPNIAVNFDAGQIQQVLINLLKNARESNSPQDKIFLSVDVDRNGLIFCVSDGGHGMSESVLKNALLPFYSTKNSGTGLGLPLCREIIEAHGGYMKLHNRENEGLDVFFGLPLHR